MSLYPFEEKKLREARAPILPPPSGGKTHPSYPIDFSKKSKKRIREIRRKKKGKNCRESSCTYIRYPEEEEFLPAAACSLGWQGAKGRARRGTGMTYDPLTRCDLVAR